MNDDDIIARIISTEGGFVNNPLDKGGPTNFGITASELGQYRSLGRPATVAEISSLTKTEAGAVYALNYIAKPGFDSIPDVNLRLIVVDSGVLHGVGRATRWLQQALSVTVDGVLGAQTIAALAAPAAAGAGKAVLGLRFKFIGSILAANPSQVVFAAGWINRVADLLQFA